MAKKALKQLVDRLEEIHDLLKSVSIAMKPLPDTLHNLNKEFKSICKQIKDSE